MNRVLKRVRKWVNHSILWHIQPDLFRLTNQTVAILLIAPALAGTSLLAVQGPINFPMVFGDHMTEHRVQHQHHPPGSEAQAGPPQEDLIPWRSKGPNPRTIGLGQGKTADLGRRIAELVGYNPFQIATVAGSVEIGPGMASALENRIKTSGDDIYIGIVLPMVPGQPAVEKHLNSLGAKLLYPVTPHGYVVKASGQVMKKLSQSPLVYAVAQCPWHLKIEPALAQALDIRGGNQPAQGMEEHIQAGKATIQIYDAEDQAVVREAMKALGVTVDQFDERGRVFQLSGVAATSVKALAQMPEISFVGAVRRQEVSEEQASTQGIVSVRSGRLNLRQGPSTENPIIGKLTKGTVVHILETQGSWHHVQVGSLRGYVHTNYVRVE